MCEAHFPDGEAALANVIEVLQSLLLGSYLHHRKYRTKKNYICQIQGTP